MGKTLDLFFKLDIGKPLETWSRNIVQGLTKALTGIWELSDTIKMLSAEPLLS